VSLPLQEARNMHNVASRAARQTKDLTPFTTLLLPIQKVATNGHRVNA
jgi:hypothetical protein